MMETQASVTTSDQSCSSEDWYGGSTTHIFESPPRRLTTIDNNWIPVKRQPVARVLFGIPDPVSTKELFRKMYEAHQTQFRERWNFDPVQGVPCPPSYFEGKSTGPRYVWTQISGNDERKVSPDEDTATTNSILNPPKQNQEDEESIVPTIRINDDDKREINQVPDRDFTNQDDDTSPKNLKRRCLDDAVPVKVLKQRHITDYWKVKKRPTSGQTDREKLN